MIYLRQVKETNMLNNVVKICLTLVLFMDLTAVASTIGLVRQAGVEFEEVDKTVSEILGEDYSVKRFVLKKDSKYTQFLDFVKKEKPALVILMDNVAVNFGKKLAKESDKSLANIPTISAMGLNLKDQLKGQATMSGVAYEVPAFTILTNFRNLLADKRLINVLTIYRDDEFANMMTDAQKQLDREGINLIGVDASHVKGSQLNSFLNRHLSETYHGAKIDAILVMTDNILMNKSTFAPIWLKKARTLKVPFLCGVKNLAISKINFCSYASFPDHNELGDQVSQQVFAILEDESSPEEVGVEYILAVKQIANHQLLKQKKINLKKEAEKALVKE